MIAGLVLAAGASSRFGAPKQVALLHGRPLLGWALATLRSAPRVDRVVVTLGAHRDTVRAAVDLGGTEVVVVPDWAAGMAASLRAGVAACGDSGADAVVVTLGDQPLLTARAVDAVVDAHLGGAAAARATYDGAPGHPVVIGRDLFDRVQKLAGPTGARHLLSGESVELVDCSGFGRGDDIDTRADLRRLERSSGVSAAGTVEAGTGRPGGSTGGDGLTPP